MRIELFQLRLFLEVAAAGSISAAARRVNIVQSALSRRMQTLEQAINTPLFVRHAGGMSLTEAGLKLKEHAERILADYSLLEEDLEQLGNASLGDVRLGIARSLASLIYAVVGSDIPKLVSGIRIHVMEATGVTLHRWLLSRKVDLAIMTGWRQESAFEYYPLWRERLFLVLPPQTRGDLGEALESVKHLPFIGVPVSNDLLQAAAAALSAHGLDVRPGLEIDSIPSVMKLIQRGDGFTLLPYFALPEGPFDGAVRVIPLPVTLARFLVRHSSTPLQGQARKFMSLLPKVLLQQVTDCEWVEPMTQTKGWSRMLDTPSCEA